MRPTGWPLSTCRSGCTSHATARARRVRSAMPRPRRPAGAGWRGSTRAVAGRRARHAPTGAPHRPGADRRARRHRRPSPRPSRAAERRVRPMARNSCASGSRAPAWTAAGQLAPPAIAARHLQHHVLAVQRAARQHPAQRLERGHRLQLVAGQRRLAHQIRRPAGQPCRPASRPPAATAERAAPARRSSSPGIQQHRQHQVGHRAGRHDQGARCQRLRVESQVAIFLGHRRRRARRAS
jgi:hypothetical protein